jgi:NitT/TauT family transport system ATP-binding protein
MTSTSVLDFRGIGKTFAAREGPVVALEGISIEVPPNSFTAIVGPSGCGKSTLLQIAAGLDTRFEGELVANEAALRRAFLFQTPRLLPWLTAEDNVAFVLEATGRSRQDSLAAARDYLGRVGLSNAAGRYPGHLSGGMQQRTAMARALVVQPELLLMDEPFSALDELTARKLRAELAALCAKTPRTVLFVTHNVTEAVYLADSVLVMSPRPGRIVADIKVPLPRPREYDAPEVALVAREVVSHLKLPD